MSWMLIILVIVIVLVIIIGLVAVQLRPSQKQGVQQIEYPYRKRDALFSLAERSFLGVLNQAVGENAQIFGKVRVADVIAPKKGMSRNNWYKAFNKISAKHFDFLPCAKNDFSILCAVELNDSSHNLKKRKARDVFLAGACLSANVPLVEITACSTYNVNEIQKLLAAYLPDSRSPCLAQEPPVAIVNHQTSNNKKTCPECSSKMVKRVAKKGKNIGNEFWACSAFPKCQYIEGMNT